MLVWTSYSIIVIFKLPIALLCLCRQAVERFVLVYTGNSVTELAQTNMRSFQLGSEERDFNGMLQGTVFLCVFFFFFFFFCTLRYTSFLGHCQLWAGFTNRSTVYHSFLVEVDLKYRSAVCQTFILVELGLKYRSVVF